jgi:hypothetical protein
MPISSTSEWKQALGRDRETYWLLGPQLREPDDEMRHSLTCKATFELSDIICAK